MAQTVELDEILQTYDESTRRAFQVWQQQLGIAVGKRGEDLSNALNRLPQFTESGADLLEVLDEQQQRCRASCATPATCTARSRATSRSSPR